MFSKGFQMHNQARDPITMQCASGAYPGRTDIGIGLYECRIHVRAHYARLILFNLIVFITGVGASGLLRPLLNTPHWSTVHSCTPACIFHCRARDVFQSRLVLLFSRFVFVRVSKK